MRKFSHSEILKGTRMRTGQKNKCAIEHRITNQSIVFLFRSVETREFYANLEITFYATFSTFHTCKLCLSEADEFSRPQNPSPNIYFR